MLGFEAATSAENTFARGVYFNLATSNI